MSNDKPAKIACLASFMREKHLPTDDLAQMAAEALRRDDRAHLLDDEEDALDECLDDTATPWQRVLAEARKLNLNVDEIRQAASGKPSGKRSGKRSAAKAGSNGQSARRRKLSRTRDDPAPIVPCKVEAAAVAAAASNADGYQVPLTRARARVGDHHQSTPLANRKDNHHHNNVIGSISKYMHLNRFF